MEFLAKQFIAKEGLGREIHSPPPLLFVLAANLLQSLVNEAYHRNLISLPLSSSYGQAYLIVQCADDTLIIMTAEARQLFFLKCLLQSFATSTGLKVNFHKSFIVPINVAEENRDSGYHFGMSNSVHAFYLSRVAPWYY
jgi:hypothetical protein